MIKISKVDINKEGVIEESIADFLEATESLPADKIHKRTLLFVLSLHKSSWSKELYQFIANNDLAFIPKDKITKKIRGMIKNGKTN